MAERNALMPFVEGTRLAVNHLWNPRPGYVNQSDGSVGILGKAFGSLGLDAEGARGATGWEDAWRNSVDADTSGRQASMLPITSDGGYGVPTMLSAPLEGFNSMWERGDEANVLNPESLRQSSEESFDAAGLAATGGLAAGALGAVPEGALAANGWGQRVKGWLGKSDPEPVGTQPYLNVVKSLPHGEQVRGVTGEPYAARVYRGSTRPDKEGGDYFNRTGFYASSSPAEASGFAYPEPGNTSQIAPLDVSFENPYVVSAAGSNWSDVPINGARMGVPDLAKMARRQGHDGLVVNDVFEQLAPNTTTVALKPGTVRSALTGDLIYSNSPTSAAAPLAVNALERKGIRAYHGSPHDFDKFSLDKIGTGEGAQAYGHGLYFAEAEPVAQQYKTLMGRRLSVDDELNEYLGTIGGNLDVAERALSRDVAAFERGRNKGSPEHQFYADQLDKVRRLKEGDKSVQAGHMYEVNINADPEQFLDWDKPLSQQPEPVRALAQARGIPVDELPTPQWNERFDNPATGNAMYYGDPDQYPVPFGKVAQRGSSYEAGTYGRGMGESQTFKDAEAAKAWIEQALPSIPDRRAGSDLYSVLSKDPAEASRLLKEAGIPGLRYYDQGSRRGASRTPDEQAGTRNLVLFDDSLVNINRKYANHPFSSAAPLAFTDNEDNSRNALMPPRHHSFSQNRSASGQFSK